jgi:hypothetical protein
MPSGVYKHKPRIPKSHCSKGHPRTPENVTAAGACRMCKRDFARVWIVSNLEKGMIQFAKRRAKRDGLPFNITWQDVIIPKRCPVLGIPLEKSSGRISLNSPTLDRIVPALGYVKGNIWVISWRANSLKKNGTLEEFKALVRNWPTTA